MIRISGALWLLPCVFGLGVWVALSDGSFGSGYSAGDLASTSTLLILTAPVTAAFIAFRLPPFLAVMRTARATRSQAAIFATCWSAVVLGGPATATLAMMSAGRTVPTDWIGWEVVGGVFLAGLAGSAFAALTARALPRVLAIPLVAVVTFSWFAFPLAGINVLLRNLNSGFSFCCGGSDQPASAMVVGSGVLNLVVVGGCLWMVGSTRWQRLTRLSAAAALAGIVAGAFGLGAAAAVATPGPLRFLPVQPRSTEPRCLAASDYSVCVWPENSDRLGTALAELRAVDDDLTRAGLPGVTAATEAAPDQHAIFVWAGVGTSTSDVRRSLALGYVERATTCGGRRSPGQPSLPRNVVDLLSGGVPADLLADGTSPAEVAAARRITELAPLELRAWFDAKTCLDLPATSR